MRCLVTGGAGFIGSHLCDALLNMGHEVVVMDNLSSGSLKNLNPAAEFVFGDVNGPGLSQVFEDSFDMVFHYSATVGVRRTIENEHKVWQDLKGIKNVADMCLKQDVKRLVFSSSSEVYGNSTPVKKEHVYLSPRLPYGMVKKEGENYLFKLGQESGLPVTSLRFFNVYGPRQDADNFVVGIFMDRLKKHKNLPVHGDGKQTRDFVYIDDNIKATLQSLKTKKTIGHSINIGSGKATSILTLARNVAKLGKSRIEFVEHPYLDVRERVADVMKLRNLVGFVPKTSLLSGLRKTKEFY